MARVILGINAKSISCKTLFIEVLKSIQCRKDEIDTTETLLSLVSYQHSYITHYLLLFTSNPGELAPYNLQSRYSLYHWNLTSNPAETTPSITDTLPAIQVGPLPVLLTPYQQSSWVTSLYHWLFTCNTGKTKPVFLTPYQQSRWVCSLWCWTHSEWSPCPPHSQRLLMVSSPEIKLSSSVCFKY